MPHWLNNLIRWFVGERANSEHGCVLPSSGAQLDRRAEITRDGDIARLRDIFVLERRHAQAPTAARRCLSPKSTWPRCGGR
jgi:hypothetical protein